jgi:hypothetical protein
MALGTTVASALVVFVYWLQSAVTERLSVQRALDFLIRPTFTVIVTFAFIVAHTIVAGAIQPLDLERWAETLVPLAFLLFGGMTLGLQIERCSHAQVDTAIRTSFWLLCAVIALRLVGAEPASAPWPKAMFPYTETSHFSLAFGPVLMYQCVSARRSRAPWWVLLGFVLGLTLQSLNLLICCVLIAAACRRLTVAAVLGLVILIGGLPLELAYFTQRIDFSSDTRNLSALVYIQGWEQVFESMTWSSGWGVGFEQLGFRESEATAAAVIRSLSGGEDSNMMDGGFVFAKFASEFGAIGVLLSLVYVVTASRCLRALRNRRSGAGITFARCVVVAYGVDMFARGTGYFVESTLLFVAALTVLWLHREPQSVSAPISSAKSSGLLSAP